MAETIYAVSGDVRDELNAGVVHGEAGWQGENKIKGRLVTTSLRRATRHVNSKLKGPYPEEIPFGASGDVPHTIQSISNDLAVYYVRRAKHPGPGPMSDEVKDEYWDKPNEQLDEIIEAAVALDELDTTDATYDDTYHNQEDRTPIFDMDDVANYEVDPDRLDDISDARD